MRSGSRRIVIAPDSFKGTITAADAAAALATGWREVRPDDEVVEVPMADGGEGTLDAFVASVAGARRVAVTVRGPAGVDVDASWVHLPARAGHPDTAVVELANTSGIELIPPGSALRPLDAGSTGFGQAIRHALDHGVDRLVLAIGSSASSDGGAGMLSVLGARILDSDRSPVGEGVRGLESASEVDLSGLPPLPAQGAVVLSDVDAPLLGPGGAARVFGPQKGATPDDVERIEAALTHWAGLVGADADIPGAGAAGGVGYGLLAWGARIVSGAEAVADLVGLRRALDGAALVITGEGSFDGQSMRGKAPGVVMDVAGETGVPTAVVAGRVAVRPEHAAVVSLTELAGSEDAAIDDPGRWLRSAGRWLAEEFSSEQGAVSTGR